MQAAIRTSDAAAVTTLLTQGASANAGLGGLTPLFEAAKQGHHGVVKVLLSHKADVSRTDTYGLTALHCACSKGHSGVAAVLIEARADVNRANADGGTPMLYAAYDGHRECVRTLLQHGADHMVTNKWGKTTLQKVNTWLSNLGHDPTIATVDNGGFIGENSCAATRTLGLKATREDLEHWAALSESEREGIKNFGWEYHLLPAWKRHRHRGFPVHLRAQLVATMLSIDRLVPYEREKLLEFLGVAIDCYKRGRLAILC